MDDMKTFCDLFYAAQYIPIVCVRDGEPVIMTGFPDFFPRKLALMRYLEELSAGLGVYTHGDLGYYGMIKLAAEDEYYMVIGPVFATAVSEDMVRLYMKENVLPCEHTDDVFGFLASIPKQTYNQFCNLLSFLSFLINGTYTNIVDQFSAKPVEQIAATHQEAMFQNREQQRIHGTYLFEMQMLDYIKKGNAEGLKSFLLRSVAERPINEGIIGDSPLRQAKNIMQGLISLIGKAAAIPGGMDVERTYQLMDSYGLECERQRSVEAVTNLQFQMLIDFANRIAQSHMPSDLTPAIYTCVQFINAHINEPISIDDIVTQIGKSRSYLTTHFRQEIGMSISEYISYAKILEAENLLRYSDRSLSEISEYLCFANQSHFQRVFKKSIGITPAEYRKRAQK